MNFYLGKPVLIGMPLAPDYRSDVRIITQLEAWDRKDGFETYYVASRHTVLGRDKIVKYAQHRRPRPSHILFVDHDVLPRKTTLSKLLAHNKDIVAGVYPMIQNCEVTWCLSREEPYKSLPINDLPDNLFKTLYVGCGMMLVKMEVFDKLDWPYWENEFLPGVYRTGEDLYFCRKVRAAGYDIWVDPKLKCNHFRGADLLGVAMEYINKGDK